MIGFGCNPLCFDVSVSGPQKVGRPSLSESLATWRISYESALLWPAIASLPR